MKLLALTMFLGLAVASAAHAETPADEISTADADRFVAFMEKVIGAVTANADACPKMAKAINTVVDANQDVLKMATEAKAAGKKLPKSHEARLTEKVKALESGLKKCKGDKSVEAALERIGKKTKVPPPAKK